TGQEQPPKHRHSSPISTEIGHNPGPNPTLRSIQVPRVVFHPWAFGAPPELGWKTTRGTRQRVGISEEPRTIQTSPIVSQRPAKPGSRVSRIGYNGVVTL